MVPTGQDRRNFHFHKDTTFAVRIEAGGVTRMRFNGPA